MQVIPESSRLGSKLVSSLSVSCIEKELCPACFVDQRTDQRPKDREHPGSADDEDSSESLRVISFADLDNMEQSLDAGSPQVPHVETFQVEQHCPSGYWLVEPVRGLFGELDALLANVESELGETFLSDAFDQTLCIHLTQSEKEDWSALPIMTVPTSRKILLHYKRLLVLQQDLVNPMFLSPE